MTNKFFLFIFLLVHYSSYAQSTFVETGLASYYGDNFQGRKTASGERFNMHAYTVAHRSLPFNTMVKVTNLKNGKSVVVRVNDRGPHKKARIVDVSKAAAKEIGLIQSGIAKVKIEVVNSTSSIESVCCHGKLDILHPLIPFNMFGKRDYSDGHSIQNYSCTFSSQTLERIRQVQKNVIPASTSVKR